jgi:hypothetical protein
MVQASNDFHNRQFHVQHRPVGGSRITVVMNNVGGDGRIGSEYLTIRLDASDMRSVPHSIGITWSFSYVEGPSQVPLTLNFYWRVEPDVAWNRIVITGKLIEGRTGASNPAID